MSPAVRGWHRLSLRWRLMVVGTAGLAAGLALGGVVLGLVLSFTQQRSIDANAVRTAQDVAQLIDDGQLPQPVPVAGVQLVQVIDGQGRVRSGSPGVDRLVPLLEPSELAGARAGERLEVGGGRAGLNGPLRVIAVPVQQDADSWTVLVAVPLEDLQEGPRLLRQALLLLFPPLVLVLAAVAWRVIGLTLRPVEELRSGAEDITARVATGRTGDGAGRLPVPAGGDEIHRLAVTLNGLLERLDAARRRQRQFIADAAHELRNPLAGMRTQLEVARRHPDRADWGELTSDLLLDTERLTRLADDLLLLARADERGPATASARGPSQRVDLEELLQRVASRYRQARVPVRVEPAADPEAGPAWADPDDLHRTLTNLVDNAVRHARGAVWLGASTDADQALVTVTDDGDGIPEADRERVFDRFTRLDGARTSQTGGAGLGLPIVAELVHRLDGSVRLSDAGPGLRVEVRLPRPPG